MMKRILALLIPASVVGVGVAASGYAHKLGFIPQGVWFYLWPALIALLLPLRENTAISTSPWGSRAFTWG